MRVKYCSIMTYNHMEKENDKKSINETHKSLDVFSYYKSVYDRELKRKEALDNDYSRSIFIILPLLLSVNFHFFSQINFENYTFMKICLSCIVLFCSFVFSATSIIYLIKAYNNFYKGFNYLTPPSLSETRVAEKKHTEDEIKFSIADRIVKYATVFQRINNKRSGFYYKCRTQLLNLTISTFINVIVFYLFS